MRNLERNEFLGWLEGFDWNFFITLNFFRPPKQSNRDQYGWNDLACLEGKPRSAFYPAWNVQIEHRKIKEVGIPLNDCVVNYAMGRTALKRWQSFIDRYFLGRAWSKSRAEDRLFFIAFPELGRKSERYDNNLHYHLLARVPYEPERFKSEAGYWWRKIIPSGQAHCQAIGHTYEDHFKTRDYATKRIMADDAYNQFIISTEFQTR